MMTDEQLAAIKNEMEACGRDVAEAIREAMREGFEGIQRELSYSMKELREEIGSAIRDLDVKS